MSKLGEFLSLSGLLLGGQLISIVLPAKSFAEELDIDRIEENYSPLISVSGSPRAGVMIGNTDEPLARGKIWVTLPQQSSGMLCVSIQSRDGRYSADIEAQLDRRLAGDYELNFDTEYKDELSGQQGTYLGMLATVREDCEGEIRSVLLSRWEEERATNQVSVLINSARLQTSLLIPQADGQERTVNCNPLDETPLVAFDKKCVFEISDSDRLSDTMILRRRFRSYLPPISLPINASME